MDTKHEIICLKSDSDDVIWRLTIHPRIFQKFDELLVANVDDPQRLVGPYVVTPDQIKAVAEVADVGTDCRYFLKAKPDDGSVTRYRGYRKPTQRETF